MSRRGPKNGIAIAGAKECSKRAPAFLSEAERKVWARLMTFLGSRPLNQLSHDACLRYCQLHVLYDTLLADVRERGLVYEVNNGFLAKNPSATMLISYHDRLRRIANDLGMAAEGVDQKPADWKIWEGLCD